MFRKHPKNGEEVTENVSYMFQFIDIARFMASSFSNLVSNLSKDFIKLNVNMDAMLRNMKLAELSIKILSAFLNTQTLKMI